MTKLKCAFVIATLAAIMWVGWTELETNRTEALPTSVERVGRQHRGEDSLEQPKKGDRRAPAFSDSDKAKSGDTVTFAQSATHSSQTSTPAGTTTLLAAGARGPLPASSKDLLAEFLEHGQIPGEISRIHELHAAFDAEPVDSSWANAAQAQLRLYIDGATENATAWLDVSSVACHQTLCEVQVVGNFPGQINPGDPMDWMAYAHRMESEQWFRDRYDFPINAVTRAPDGRVIYLTYFSRRPQLKSERLATR
jgi:hypothetical protein